MGMKKEKEIKSSSSSRRKMEDGLLLVILVRIYDHNSRAVIDRGTTWFLVIPSRIMTCGLKMYIKKIL